MTQFLKILNYLFVLIGILSSCGLKNDSLSNQYYVDNKNTQKKDNNKNHFAGTNSCIPCHKKEHDLWENSHHDLSMQEANLSTVLGDFNNVEYISKGIKYKFFKKNNNFIVNTKGENGEYHDYKIAFTFGIYPLQQYLINFPKGKVQCLLVAWDSKNKKWYDLQPTLKTHHKDWLNWTGGSMTWNNMCADCHSTNLKKNYNSKKDAYKTTHSIMNVSCEACHGPATIHINYYNNKNKSEKKPPPRLHIDKLTPSKELVDKCARCHSRRLQITPYYDYKGFFLDHYNPQLLTPPIYEPDGQIKDEVYVYGSFIQSKMYHNNVSCTDCHNPHSLKLKKTGNTLCLNCHTESYNNYSHHFHLDNNNGSKCINCHMPSKVYMGIDRRYDHSFRVPRPDQSEKYRTPNTCTSCHKDKPPSWASAMIAKYHGTKRQKNFTDDLLTGYSGNKNSYIKVFLEKNNPNIVRATALRQFAQGGIREETRKIIFPLLSDSSALVRKEAIISLGINKSREFYQSILPFAKDSIRLIRITVADQFEINNMSSIESEDLFIAKEEYMTSLNVNADFPSGQHQLALLYQAMGQTKKAIRAYYHALEIDNYYNLSRLNLALLEYQNGNISVVEKLYLKTISQEPEYSYTYFMLGLLYHENSKLDKALEYLRLATEKDPPNIKAFYNYSLLLHKNGKYRQSLKVINVGLSFFPRSQKLLNIKALNELKENDK